MAQGHTQMAIHVSAESVATTEVAALRQEANVLLANQANEMSQMTRSIAEHEAMKYNATAEAKITVSRQQQENIDIAAQGAIIGIDHAALATTLKSDEIAERVLAMQGQADALVAQASTAASKSATAAREALAWAANLPADEAKQMKFLTDSALSISLGLQSQAGEVSQMDHLVTEMASESKIAAGETIRRTDNAMNYAVEATRQSTANAEIVKTIKDLSDEVAEDSAKGAEAIAASAVDDAASAAVR